MENSNRLRIVLVDSQYFFRRGLRAVLSREPDFEISGEVGTLKECFDILRSDSADLVLIEAGLTDEPARAALRALRPAMGLLFLANQSMATSLSACGEMAVVRDDAATLAVAAIRRMAGRMPTVSPSNAAEDLRALAESTNNFSLVPGLTLRESEVVKILAEGRTAREVAGELGLSIKTIEAHKLNVMRKLGIHNRAALIRYAVQQQVGQAR